MSAPPAAGPGARPVPAAAAGEGWLPRLFGGTGPLVLARAAGLGVTFVAPLVLARVLALDEYGTYKQLFLVAQALSFALPLGMAQSLYYFLPRADRPGPWLAQTVAFLAGAGAVAALLVAAGMPLLAGALDNPALLEHRAALAVYVCGLVAAAPLEVSLTALGRTRRAAAAWVVSDVGRAAALIVPALLGHGLAGLTWAMAAWAAARVAATAALLARVARGGGGAAVDRPRLREQLAYALPFGAAVLLSLPPRFAHELAVAAAASPAVYAIYAAGVFQVPIVDLLYTPTGELLMVRLAALERGGRLADAAAAFCEAAARLVRFLIPLAAFLAAAAPEFIAAAFGPRFAGAAPIFRVAVLAIPLYALPVDAALRARGEIRWLFRAYAGKAAFAVASVGILVGVLRLGAWGGVSSLLLTELAGAALLASRLPRALGAGDPAPWRALLPAREALESGAAAAAGVAAVALSRHLFPQLTHAESAIALRLAPLAAAAASFAAANLLVLAAARALRPPLPGPVPAR